MGKAAELVYYFISLHHGFYERRPLGQEFPGSVGGSVGPLSLGSRDGPALLRLHKQRLIPGLTPWGGFMVGGNSL